MDIKYVWLYEKRKYDFVLTVIDTFTRYVQHWLVGRQQTRLFFFIIPIGTWYLYASVFGPNNALY
ncbi:MAG: hypothetical protein ACJATI_003557 [Halioglobus sp.]|jgi:hypothetical protein